MASSNFDNDSSSMFLQKSEKPVKSPTRSEPSSRRNSTVKTISAEHITIKDFFDFMKTAYQVYEQLEGESDDGPSINWEEITKLTIINHVIEQQERDLLYQTAYSQQKDIISKSDMAIERRNSEKDKNLVFNEGILDSILPYLVGYKKAAKTTSLYMPIIKKPPSSGGDMKKPASFGAFVNERESRDRLGRRKSSIVTAQERVNQRQEGEVEIHVCDEVKGLKKDFRCPQKLLVSKMGYFADVTAGQRLEDMDISVHCDIQIFDWLMRWVKRDSILVADWPLLEPNNVIPILVSASFLQALMFLHLSPKDMCRKSHVREQFGLKDDVVTRVEKVMLRWFGRLDRMNESRLTEEIYRFNVCGGKVRVARHALVNLATTRKWTTSIEAGNGLATLLELRLSMDGGDHAIGLNAGFAFKMDPLLQDCLTYCHAHMSEVVKTSTNLACLSDTLITRLAAMYTNTELEAVKDRKDKIQSRLYCKMILSLAEPVPETLRGHYATLATLFKCSKCNKLLGRHIADQVSCQPACMRIDQRGNVISSHCKYINYGPAHNYQCRADAVSPQLSECSYMSYGADGVVQPPRPAGAHVRAGGPAAAAGGPLPVLRGARLSVRDPHQNNGIIEFFAI
ncbi:Uncharacterized protein KIAA1841 homolog [Eumeta japonica]|uniref:Uncharacterized protein KIAA1841 homolog n=1 Tax=Eumeta variegata TaxID=151549 RepID=A0A4C1VBN9_EUMVA|nr:Uncharacterized protein KIAA1841 homolog [Eumeta japonica]